MSFCTKSYGPSNDISKNMVSKRMMVGDTYNSLMERALVPRTLQGFKGSLNKFLEHKFSGHYKRDIIKFLDYF